MLLKPVYPLDKTLEKYGLTRTDYLAYWKLTNGACPICEKVPTSGRLNIDHEHIKGWKNLPPEKRKLYVRGLVCFFCNRYYLAKSINVNKARNIIKFLEAYGIRQKRII